MKMAYSIIGLILIGIIIFYLTSCKNKQRSKQTNDYTSKSEDTIKAHNLPNNNFIDLRNMALDVTPDQLELSLPVDQIKVFGVVMDWDLGDGTMTLVTYQTGDASMYLSSGGGVIGGGQHVNVSKVSKEFVLLAQKYLDKAFKADTTTLPDKDCFKFYFLTNKGKFTAQETIDNIEKKSSKWLDLFESANNVITELRIVSKME
jgi:preprotein translocase subunit YajC